MRPDVRQLKLDDASLAALWDTLDVRDAQQERRRDGDETRFAYRVRLLRLETHAGAADGGSIYAVAARMISRVGVSLLCSHVLHKGTRVSLRLLTMQNSWQTAAAKVRACRYIEGSANTHELDLIFDQPIDPASFAASAIRARVLLADDSLMARRLITHMLEPLNVEVTGVVDGAEAVKAALEGVYDLILMDWQMPEMDGLSAAQLLRQKGYLRPIVAITCKSRQADRESCLLAGCDDFIAKPPKRQELASVVQRTRPHPLVSALLHEDGMTELIDAFVVDLMHRSRGLEQAYNERDLDALLCVTRDLKGEAGGFGFPPITRAAAKLEAALEAGVKFAALRPLLSQLVRLCLAARPASCDAITQARLEAAAAGER